MAREGNSNRKKGAHYEQLAADYLERQGFQILQRNFHSRFGEIDLIASEGKYCLRHGFGEGTPCRFDVVGIIGDEVIHIPDAFGR